ncbi:MAG: YbaY family lipoprotein [Dehalococcoidia bacterium]
MRKLIATLTAAGSLAALLAFVGPDTPAAFAAQPPDGAALTGVVWQWQHTVTSTESFVPDDPSRYTIEFQPDGRASIRADCNRGSGSYEATGNQLTFGPIATTLAACPPASLGSDFLRQLNDAGVYSTDGHRLFIGLKSSVAVMSFVNPASATQAAVTGVVTYRQRIALPSGVVVRVQLQDISRADAPAVVLGEQVIEPMGRQVPFPFSIAYDPDAIDPRGRYTVRARIESATGDLLWTSTQAYPVITAGNPTSDIEVIVQPVG